MKWIWSGVALVCLQLACFFSVSMADQSELDKEYYVGLLSENLPPGWKIMEVRENAIPHGHIKEDDESHAYGLYVSVVGGEDVFVRIANDEGEILHRTPVAKEELKIWIMPRTYSRSWKRFFTMKAPIPAEKIFAGKKVKVYVNPTHTILNKERYREVSRDMGFRDWPDSPHTTGELSWRGWENAIKDIFRGE